jgi:signal peptidase I
VKKNQKRNAMQVGDRVLINKFLRKELFLVARADIPHSNERVFVTKSGYDFTIGLKIWKADYTWNEKNQMWTPKR